MIIVTKTNTGAQALRRRICGTISRRYCLKFLLEDNCSVVVRPSGTEPKLKTYLSVTADSMEEAAKLEQIIKEDLDRYFK